MLGKNQTEAAKASGLVQRDISMLENGDKKFIPTAYIYYLHNSGIDINSIFSDEPLKMRSAIKLSGEISPSESADSGQNLPENGGQFVRKQEFLRLEKVVKSILKKLDK